MNTIIMIKEHIPKCPFATNSNFDFTINLNFRQISKFQSFHNFQKIIFQSIVRNNNYYYFHESSYLDSVTRSNTMSIRR